jgi:hypothetical protein
VRRSSLLDRCELGHASPLHEALILVIRADRVYSVLCTTDGNTCASGQVVHVGEALLEYFSVDEIYEHVLLQGGRPAAAAAVLMVDYKRRKLIHLALQTP